LLELNRPFAAVKATGDESLLHLSYLCVLQATKKAGRITRPFRIRLNTGASTSVVKSGSEFLHLR